MTTDKALGLRPEDEVFFAGVFYRVAEIKKFPHGIMVGIKDEPPTDHVDFLNPDSLGEVLPCTRCQGGGCPDCGGHGKYVQLTQIT